MKVLRLYYFVCVVYVSRYSFALKRIGLSICTYLRLISERKKIFHEVDCFPFIFCVSALCKPIESGYSILYFRKNVCLIQRICLYHEPIQNLNITGAYFRLFLCPVSYDYADKLFVYRS